MSVDASYQLGYATHTENVSYPVTAHYLIPLFEYGVTDNLAVSASLPFEAIKAEAGTHAHGPWDDGSYHATPTDARLTTRYMIPVSILAITPHIGVSVPVRDYPYEGSGAPGRGLKAGYLGLDLGIDLGDYIADTTVHMSYELAIVEHFKKAGPEAEALDENYSVFAAELGHAFGKLHAHLGVDYHYYHGGIAFSEFPMLTQAEKDNHDPILRERILLLGGGFSYDVGEHTSLYATTRIFLSGENTSNASLFALGANWDFNL